MFPEKEISAAPDEAEIPSSPEGGGLAASPASAPTLVIPADKAAALKGEQECTPGNRYTLTVTVKEAGEDGSLTLEVPPDAQFLPDESAQPSPEIDRFSGPTITKGVGKSLED